MSTSLNLQLNNYTVMVTTASENEIIAISSMINQLLPMSNPREIVSLIESVSGVESTVVRDLVTDEVVLSSGLLTPEA